VFVNHKGQRKAKCVGDSRAAAVEVKRVLEAKFVLGNIARFSQSDSGTPDFGSYADLWLKEYARTECKSSTADGDCVFRLPTGAFWIQTISTIVTLSLFWRSPELARSACTI